MRILLPQPTTKLTEREPPPPFVCVDGSGSRGGEGREKALQEEKKKAGLTKGSREGMRRQAW
jgi:hypothetical protein